MALLGHRNRHRFEIKPFFSDNIHQEQVSSDENADNGGTFQDDAGEGE
jgi:hypothetical protein